MLNAQHLALQCLHKTSPTFSKQKNIKQAPQISAQTPCKALIKRLPNQKQATVLHRIIDRASEQYNPRAKEKSLTLPTAHSLL